MKYFLLAGIFDVTAFVLIGNYTGLEFGSKDYFVILIAAILFNMAGTCVNKIN